MSPDRVTMTRAEAIRRRREEEQKKRESQAQKRASTPRPAPVQPKVDRNSNRPAPVATNRHSRRYDIALSTPYGREATEAQAPAFALHMPKFGFGARWISFLLIALCSTGLYYLTSDSLFVTNGASVIGNSRVSVDEISSALGVMGKPSVLLNPAQIEYNILATFPDISAVQVQINLPAEVVVSVSERQPVAAWQQGGQTVWVDAQGYAFPPRGLVEGLVTISAAGSPAGPDSPQSTQIIGARPFLSPAMATALVTISPRVPPGSTLIYDPRYGLGWTDPRGWQAYFGHTDSDMTTKLKVYQSMLDFLSKQGLKPTLISVEYPDTPFYRTQN